MLKFEVNNLDGIDESLHSFYEQSENGYRLKVEGIDPADEIKGALRKEREANKEAKAKLMELEKMRDEAERKALEEQGKYKELSERERNERLNAQKQFEELQKKVATTKSDLMIRQLAQTMTSDATEIDIISRFAKDFVEIQGEEAKFAKSEDELKAELSRFVRSKANDVNDKGNQGGGNANTISRSDFNALSAGDKAKFVKDGGQLKD